MLAFLISLPVNILMLTGSIYMLQVYDRVLSSGSVPTLLSLFAIVALLYLFLGFYDALRRQAMRRLALRLDQHVGDSAFEESVRAAARRPGARPLLDLELVRGFLSGQGAIALLDLPFTPLFIAVLFLIHPWLGWLTLAGVAVTVLIAALGQIMARRAAEPGHAAEAAERGLAESARAASETIGSMGMMPTVGARWREKHTEALHISQSRGEIADSLSAASHTFRMFLQSAILTLGALLVLTGDITAGMIIAASILSGRVLAPMDQISGNWQGLGRALAAHRRLRATLGGPADLERKVDLPDPESRIAVRNVSLAVRGAAGGEPVRLLSQIDFALEPGDVLGVLGPSGSGKSTLMRILAGGLAPTTGEVRLGRATLQQYSEERLGRHVGYLPQTVQLLPGTIRDNIARMSPDATDTDILRAANLAGAHEMILGLPQGYATSIGQPGDLPLSGGQRQRIALARAVFRMPRVVILDEPNAHLDVDGETALNDMMATLRRAGRTVIVTAHRPGALDAINKTLVLSQGRATHFGPKDEVLRPAAVPAAASAAGPGASATPGGGLKPVAVGVPRRAGETRPAGGRRWAASLVHASGNAG